MELQVKLLMCTQVNSDIYIYCNLHRVVVVVDVIVFCDCMYVVVVTVWVALYIILLYCR